MAGGGRSANVNAASGIPEENEFVIASFVSHVKKWGEEGGTYGLRTMRVCEARQRNGMEFVSPFKCAQLGDSFSSISPKRASEADLRQKSRPKASACRPLSLLSSDLRGGICRFVVSGDGEGGFNPTRTDFNCIPCRTPLETRRQWTSVRLTSSSDPMSVPSPCPYPSVPLPSQIRRPP